MDKNWTEDFGHENGRYSCFCIDCGHEFKGHKRRISCRACTIDSITERIQHLNQDLAILVENKRRLEELCPHDWDTISLNGGYKSNICRVCGTEIIEKK